MISGGKLLGTPHLIPEGGYSYASARRRRLPRRGRRRADVEPPRGLESGDDHGRLADETVIEAKKGDYTKATLTAYVDKLNASYVLPDMEDIKDLEEHVENSAGFPEFYPKLACELAQLRFSADGVPKREHLKTALGMIRQRGFLRVAKDLFPLRKVAI